MKSEYIYCTKVTPYFFDNNIVDKEENFVKRVLPMITNYHNVELIYTEEDRKNFYFNNIVAQPDAVLSQQDHLLVVEYKSLSNSKKYHNQEQWKNQIRFKDILQCVINSMQVSAVTKKPCVSLLRYPNVVYFISPEENLIKYIVDKTESIKYMFNESKYISSSQLSEALEPVIKRLLKEENNDELGKQKHEEMLRK